MTRTESENLNDKKKIYLDILILDFFDISHFSMPDNVDSGATFSGTDHLSFKVNELTVTER